jgi:hypothetical protein
VIGHATLQVQTIDTPEYLRASHIAIVEKPHPCYLPQDTQARPDSLTLWFDDSVIGPIRE